MVRQWRSGIGFEGLGGTSMISSKKKDWMVKERVVSKVDDVSLVDGVFDGSFGGDGEGDFVIGKGVVVLSSSLDRSTKSCLGEIMVILIFLERLEEEACVDAMEVEEK
ncbi:hypothetical protein Tco_1554144 [Tanacetum coccineum]